MVTMSEYTIGKEVQQLIDRITALETVLQNIMVLLNYNQDKGILKEPQKKGD